MKKLTTIMTLTLCVGCCLLLSGCACETCGQDGSLECQACYGSGSVKSDCKDCWGGAVNCANCGGDGRDGAHTCTVCGGTGDKSCSHCWGLGYFNDYCGGCGGPGQVECPDCSGSGYSGSIF